MDFSVSEIIILSTNSERCVSICEGCWEYVCQAPFTKIGHSTKTAQYGGQLTEKWNKVDNNERKVWGREREKRKIV